MSSFDHLDVIGRDLQRFSGKTVLLTGAAGFLGHHFVATFRYLNKYVLDSPCKVIAVDNFITADSLPIMQDDHIEAWHADVTVPLRIPRPIHFIIHAAGIASPVKYQKYPLETITAAVDGTRNMLELARVQDNFGSLLFFSSSEIYGDPDANHIPTREDYNGNVSTIGPRACYDESKRMGETLVKVYQEQYRVPAKIVRPFNIFGPGMPHGDGRAIPSFTHQALNGHPISIFKGGVQTRTFCYITDAIIGFLKVLLEGRDGEAYNIGSLDNEIMLKDLGALFVDLIPGTELQFVPYPDKYPTSEPLRRCPDITKAFEQLGYVPKVKLREGVEKFIEWAASHGYIK